MAVVTDTIAMDPTYLPYERPPDTGALWTAIPRGLRGFQTFSALSSKPINDDQIFNLQGTLSPNYAYVFAEMGVLMTQDAATQWADEVTLNLQNWYQGFLALSMTWQYQFLDHGLGFQQKCLGGPLNWVPRAPMWSPKDVSGILINISAFNPNDPAANAGTVTAYINFWEFDLEQARKFPVNAPVPVHAR